MRKYVDWISAGEVGDVTVGWPHTLAEAISVHPLTGRRILSAEFEQHISDYKVWTWSPAILSVMPDVEELGGTIRRS